MNQRSFCAIFAILFSAACAHLVKADYTITAIPTGNIVPTGGPSINNAGTIAFAGSQADGTTGIYTYSGGTLSTVVDSSGPLTGFVAAPIINNNGLVTFRATSKTGPEGNYVASAGGPLLTIAEGTNWVFSGGPTINDAGTVVFSGFFNGTAAIWSGNGGGAPTAVVSVGGSEGYTGFGEWLSINSSGVVAFTASTSTGPVIATHAPGQMGSSTVADTSGSFTAFDFPSINDSGTVAFTGLTPDTENQSFSGIYTKTVGGSVSPLITKGGSDEVMNNNGQIIYVGNINPSAYLMYGPDPSDVALGNTVNGAPIVQLVWGGRSLNDNGQFVFGYQLSDGTYGIGLGTPTPEPGGVIGAALGAMLLIRRRRATPSFTTSE